MLAGFVRAVMCILLSLSFALFLQIWDYGAARTHARILMQIGASAGHEDRRHVLMQCYDETVRYMWAEKARRGDEGFNVNIASLTLDLEALSSAKHLCDTQYPKSVKNTKGAERSSNKFSDRSFPSHGVHLFIVFALEPWFRAFDCCSQARTLAVERERASGRTKATTRNMVSGSSSSSSLPSTRRSGTEMSPGTHGELRMWKHLHSRMWPPMRHQMCS